MTILSIVIPSYDRNQILEKSLSQLSVQLTDDVSVLVIDNCSPQPVNVDKSLKNVKVIRNNINIGGNGNIIRCFEMCESDWIWVLGDDDMPMENAIQSALVAIKEHPNSLIINFSTVNAFTRNTELFGRGIDEFLKKLDDFGNLLFISSSIFNSKKIRQKIEYGYHYSYSCAPHIAMLLMSMDDDAEFRFTAKALVRWERQIEENRGSLLVISKGLPILLDLPLTPIRRHLLGQHLSLFPSVSAIAHQIFLQIVFSRMKKSEARKLFKTILKRVSIEYGVKRRLIGYIWGMLMYFPATSYSLIVKPLYHRMTGHESGKHKIGLERL
jgi:glycosyltransferase involved in cell wall biosynthesis